MNPRMPAPLAVGHMTTDLYQGALPVLLPFLEDARQLPYTQIGTIVLVMRAASSLIQPLFGYLSDRTERVRLMPFVWALPADAPPPGGCLQASQTAAR